jgi:Ni,Fe-hydrogenase III component G
MSALEQIKRKFAGQVEVQEKSPRRVYLTAAKELARTIVRYCFCDLGARFSIVSAVDTRTGVELLYHLAFDREQLMLTVKTLVKKPELEMESCTDFMPAANWIEREIAEMFGVKFAGHPQLATLLLPDDWPDGVYPLRKNSFDSEKENTEREN